MPEDPNRPRIEQPVNPGQIPTYPHPANLPQCMVHGHVELRKLYVEDRASGYSFQLTSCRMCGTVYTTQEG